MFEILMLLCFAVAGFSCLLPAQPFLAGKKRPGEMRLTGPKPTNQKTIGAQFIRALTFSKPKL